MGDECLFSETINKGFRMNLRIPLYLVFSATLFSLPARAGFQDLLQGAIGGNGGEGGLGGAIGEAVGGGSSSALPGSEVAAGLKEALANGVEKAVSTLGKPNGFLGNELVRIGLPDSLKTVAQVASQVGGKRYVDGFVSSMNHAAEQATPKAAKVLGDAIREMSVDDAMKILKGPDDAATRYFREHAGKRLEQQFLPIVKQATDQAGATRAYKQLLKQGQGLTGGSGGGLLGGALGGMVGGGASSLDLDQYVTDKTLDGLFKYIAIEEKQIRTNPVARSSELLKKVFRR